MSNENETDAQTEIVEFEINKEKYELTISNDLNSISFSLVDPNKTEYFFQTNLKQLQKIDNFFTFFNNLKQVSKSLLKQINDNNVSLSRDGNFWKFIIKNPINEEEFYIELEKTQTDEKDVNEENNDSVSNLRKKIDFLEKKSKDFNERIGNLEKIIDNVKYIEQNDDEDGEEEETDDGIQLFKSSLINRKEEKVIKGFIKGKILSAELIFDTEKDGDTIDDFKKNCEGKFPTLFIIKTAVGSVFGGYATSAWKENGPIPDYNAFVYTLNPNKKYAVTMPKFGLYGYRPNENIMFQFGSVGFRIEGKCTKNSNNVIRGSNYEKGFLDFIQGDHKFRVSRLEVFKLNF